jgi:alkylation response protein AidB-like acyl-CoA dehydrogenase
VNLRFTAEHEAFRQQVRSWLAEHLTGEFAALRGRGGPGDEDAPFALRRAWEQTLARAGWTCLDWPPEHGGRGASLAEQVIFNEEYARARAPGRMGHIGETLLGPTLIAFASDEQKRRFLPAIRRGDEYWCQGYSEPNAGSDLANVQTRAHRVGDHFELYGQKIWTSLAHRADWCFALCRTDPEAPAHRGLSYLLVPMRQPGVEIRPIEQMTGSSEFFEVFFDGARTRVANVVGQVNDGWKVAMGTLAFERGASTLGQQMAFHSELATIVDLARENGAAQDPLIRQRLADAWMGLRIMRLNALRMLSNPERAALSREGLITKLYWSTWHRKLGELAMDVLGSDAELLAGAPYQPSALQRLFLFSRADTIYAGSSQIQRTIIGERALGLPREPRSP